jgi:hypothetical protein
LLALGGSHTPSVVRIRIEGLRDEALAALIQRVIAIAEDDLRRGSAVTVMATSIRIRTLPLVR